MARARSQPGIVEKEPVYYAKSGSLIHGPITNAEHLSKVSTLASEFGKELGIEKEAALAGIFHDFGKYSQRFQNVLCGKEIHIDHALPGAAFLYKMSLQAPGRTGAYGSIIEAVFGHHDGLVSFSELYDSLLQTLKRENADHCPSGKLPALRGNAEFQQAVRAFQKDFPQFRFPKLPARPMVTDGQVQNMLDTRMLFSCLVDADYSVSAMDDDPAYLAKSTGSALNIDLALQNLLDYQSKIKQASSSATEVNKLRNQVFERCGEAAATPAGLFTLTAPTGVGKTLAMMNFALRHCKQNNLPRIIVVLPYLSLAEQTQSVYQNIFPEILVDHSQQELTEETRDMAARWAAPVIITTSVRFFESLFSDKPTDCRKLHHIANSVVLFDEAQSLPGELAKPTVEAVQTLCQKYHCSMVFSTATQPDFSGLDNVDWKPVEILPDHAELFQKMRRVSVEWRLAKNEERKNKPDFAQIAMQMAEETNVCCIVNLRRHASVLVKELTQCKGTEEGIYLISTDLCPGHRLKVIQEIKARQKSGQPCYVVATQCIEAGVDLDFDMMYRSLAPLEAVVQAAGRCNRNGRCPGGGKMVVFEPKENGSLYPGDAYAQGAAIVSGMWSRDAELDIQDPAVIQQYYLQLFSENHSKNKLQKALEQRCYSQVAHEYRLISKRGIQLIVPWDGASALFAEIEAAGRNNAVDMQLLRKAASITITCFDEEAIKAFASPLCRKRRGQIEETGTYIVNPGFQNCYDSRWGLKLDGIMPENLFV